MDLRQMNDNVMNVLHKAISHDPTLGTAVREFIKEDLEIEAHNQLWNEEDPDQLVLLKLIPRGGAKQVNHQFTKLDSFGNTHMESGFAANALPGVQDFKGTRETTVVKPYGGVAQVQGLAALEQAIGALGKSGIVEIDKETVRRSLLYRINVDMVESDTRLTHNANKFKGIIQLIDEATRATGATVPDSNVIIDMRGDNLSLEGSKGIREKSREIQDDHGKLRWLIMPTLQMQKLEDQLDNKARYMIETQKDPSKKIIGARIDGAMTSSGLTMFAPDVALSNRILCGYANDAVIVGSPNTFAQGSGAGTFAAPAAGAPGSGVTSQFAVKDVLDQSGTGSNSLKFAYGVVALNDIGASLVGYSTTFPTVAAGQVVSFEIRPRGDEKSFKIYRGIMLPDDSGFLFQPEFIAEVPNGAAAGNTTPFTFVDDNSTLPGTGTALGLNLHSEHGDTFALGKVPTTLANRARKATNGVSLVQLTNMFLFDLAKISWLAAYELYAWVLAPQVERPKQHRIWKNLGRKQVVTGLYT